MLVAKPKGVAKLMDDHMYLVLITGATVEKVKVHRRFWCLNVLCSLSQFRIANFIICDNINVIVLLVFLIMELKFSAVPS